MISFSAVILCLWGAFLLLLERLFPAAQTGTNWQRLGRNLGLAVLVLFVAPLVQFATARALGAAGPLWPTKGLIIQLLILDLWTYGMHRAYHRFPLMWRMHGVHHLDARLDVTSAIRFHLAEILWSGLLRLVPLLVFGISLEVNMLFGTILTGCALFHHSNIRIPERAEAVLSLLIVTPAIHWVHHHAAQRDTDSNFAAVLSVWDWLFASRSATQRWQAMPIGIENEGERKLAALLLWPLRR